MILVEKHQYSKTSKHYKELDKLCFLAKNLYNVSLYHVRQHFFKTGEYLNCNKLNQLSNDLFKDDYTALPRKVSQQVQKLLDQNFKSFFCHLKVLKTGEKISVPKYLDKEKGRQVLTYTSQALSHKTRNVPEGYVKLSGLSFLIKTSVEKIKFARIVPNKNYITVEIGYEKKEVDHIDSGRYASIDIGINNLATITSNIFQPFILNGKPIKSINQYYNKRIAELSARNKNRWSNKMYSITRKRNNKISDYMHKASRFIVNHLVENRVDTLVIGHNNGWKQDTNIGKVNNQKFVQIPFNMLIHQLTYKCSLVGIKVILQEESYTSKSSFLNQDKIPIFGEVVSDTEFSGKRICRGLYKPKDRKSINADVNGSYNILRKYLIKQEAWNENIFSDCVEVCSTPTVYNC